MPTSPRILITTGEPAGIGPDLIVQVAQTDWRAQLIAVGDKHMLQRTAERLRLPLLIQDWQPGLPATKHIPSCLWVWDTPLPSAEMPGMLNVSHAPSVLRTLDRACDACLDGSADAIVTAPIHKAIINDAGIEFSGHTEYFQARCGSERVVMLLACPSLRVALATTHLPLRAVADAITPERLTQVLRILHHELRRKFGIAQPHILVAGLNPHAGEDGHLGLEERDVIIPTLESLREEGMNLTGPLPADTLFTPHLLKNADAVLAMYHDQGLPVLKYAGFGQAVNITLGLPIIRTSVDHGTALSLARTGKADDGSMRSAIDEAIKMARIKGNAL